MDFTPLGRVAATQHGLLTAGDFARAGATRKIIDRWADTGFITPMFKCVWRLVGAEPSYAQRVAAALMSIGPPAAAAHRTAMALWQVPGVNAETVELVVPRSRNPKIDGVLVRRSDDLQSSHLRSLDGIALTSPARTLVDLAALVPQFVLSRALEHWLTRTLLTLGEVQVMLDTIARRGRPGVPMLRSIVASRALGDDVADSSLETLTAELLRAAGLTAVFHHLVVDRGEIVAELDFAFVDEQVYLESDGFGYHSSRQAFDHDRCRQNRLSELAWLPVRFSDRQLRLRGPAAMETTRRVLIARRAERALVAS